MLNRAAGGRTALVAIVGSTKPNGNPPTGRGQAKSAALPSGTGALANRPSGYLRIAEGHRGESWRDEATPEPPMRTGIGTDQRMLARPAGLEPTTFRSAT